MCVNLGEISWKVQNGFLRNSKNTKDCMEEKNTFTLGNLTQWEFDKNKIFLLNLFTKVFQWKMKKNFWPSFNRIVVQWNDLKFHELFCVLGLVEVLCSNLWPGHFQMVVIVVNFLFFNKKKECFCVNV